MIGANLTRFLACAGIAGSLAALFFCTCSRTSSPSGPGASSAEGALKQVTVDVSATVGDVAGQYGISSTVSNPTPESQGIWSVIQATGIIRIIFRLP